MWIGDVNKTVKHGYNGVRTGITSNVCCHLRISVSCNEPRRIDALLIKSGQGLRNVGFGEASRAEPGFSHKTPSVHRLWCSGKLFQVGTVSDLGAETWLPLC